MRLIDCFINVGACRPGRLLDLEIVESSRHGQPPHCRPENMAQHWFGRAPLNHPAAMQAAKVCVTRACQGVGLSLCLDPF